MSLVQIGRVGGTNLADGLDLYLNTLETTSGTTVLADDFHDGFWHNVDGDDAAAGTTAEKGWVSLKADPNDPVPAGAIITPGEFGASNYIGTHGAFSGTTAANHAAHEFKGGSYDELYVRFYTRARTGYTFGSEKVLTFNKTAAGTGGIDWGNVHFNLATAAGPTATLKYQAIPPQDEAIDASFTLSSNVWYFIEVYMKLNTPGDPTPGSDGLLKVWADDVGSDGGSPPGSPTLRINRTDMQYNRLNSGELIRHLWWEAWANPNSVGTRDIAYIFVDTAGPIGLL